MLVNIDRFDFYDKAKKSYCIIATSEKHFMQIFYYKKG